MWVVAVLLTVPLASRWPHLSRKEGFQRYAKGGRQEPQLPVGHTTELSFNFRKCRTCEVPSKRATAGRERLLGKATLEAKLADHGSDDVL